MIYRAIALFALLFLIVLSGRTYAQPAKSPYVWLEPEQLDGPLGAPISIWRDLSNNGFDFQQSDASQRPYLDIDSTSKRPVARFSGGQQLRGPMAYPVQHDYTLLIVGSITDPNKINNWISGYQHALWFENSLHPLLMHWNLTYQAEGWIPIEGGLSLITITYREATTFAKMYVNDRYIDSFFIGSNIDPGMLLGSYEDGYYLSGSIAELLIYDRILNSDQLGTTTNYLRTKYSIAQAKPLPTPNRTFSEFPEHLQLYPRSIDDSAIVTITGRVHQSGFDSVYMLLKKNDSIIRRQVQYLNYEGCCANFSFLPKIHSEPSEYSFYIFVKGSSSDSLLGSEDSVIAGDAFLVDGQSNAVWGIPYPEWAPNEYCRTFGINPSPNYHDTLWEIARVPLLGAGPAVGAWAFRIQKNILEKQHIPTCVINGSVVATDIFQHLRNDSLPTDLQTIYGRILYRTQKARLAKSIRAFFWDQGEWSYIKDYLSTFRKLHAEWMEDFPAIEKVYVTQTRPASCSVPNSSLRDLERRLQDSIPNFRSFATAGVADYANCHFEPSGYAEWGDELYEMVAHDLYHSVPTTDFECPNIQKAVYLSGEHSTIALIFPNVKTSLRITPDTIVHNSLESLKDYFYLDDQWGYVRSVQANKDSIILQLTEPRTFSSISYLPDTYYHSGSSDDYIYQGPWIKNADGLNAFIFWHVPLTEVRGQVTSAPPYPDLSLYPNPCTNSTTLSFSAATSENLFIQLIDVNGKVVFQRNYFAQAGNNDFSITLPELASGVYQFRLTGTSYNSTSVLVITK